MFKKVRNPKDEQSGSEPPISRMPESASPDSGSKHDQTPPHTPATTPAMSGSESLAHDIKEGVLNGFIGDTAELSGNMSFTGVVRIDGHLSGNISSEDGTLIVSPGAQIDAQIAVGITQVYGTVTGDIIATKRVEIRRTARVIGNIQTPELVMDEGAIFEGGCRMGERGSSKQAAKAARASA